MLGSYLKICSPFRLAYGVIISFGKRVGGVSLPSEAQGPAGPSVATLVFVVPIFVAADSCIA